MTILYIKEADLGAANSVVGVTKKPAIELNPAIALADADANVFLVAKTNDDASTLGDKTAKALAQDFANFIPEKKEALKKLYIVAPRSSYR